MTNCHDIVQEFEDDPAWSGSVEQIQPDRFSRDPARRKFDRCRSEGLRSIVWFLLASVLLLFQSCVEKPLQGDADNGGLILPDGFEALVVADSLGSARHLAVRDNGDIYVKLRYPLPEGENIALRDRDGDGKPEVIKHWGDYGQKGKYGNAMRIHNGYLYTSTASEVYRHKLRRNRLLPEPKGELLLTDNYDEAPFGYEHIAKPLAFDGKGHMYVQFGAPSDCCQEENRRPGSPGIYPCPELEWHSGVWQFSDSKPNQYQRDGYHYATGIRSIVGMQWNRKEDALYALQHGRDNMHRMWPEYFSPWESAMLPSEELLRVDEGTDAGWPYYYYDQMVGKKLLNPEYGGDGEAAGGADTVTWPLMGFPGHWAPNDLLFYTGDQFPERYRNGAFIAFHGSTIRAPYPQSGYFIGFVPFAEGRPSGPWEIFADGFGVVDTIVNTSDAIYRPMGLAQGPDGSLFLSESEEGKIWRILFRGDRENFGDDELVRMERRRSLPHIKTPDPELDNMDRGRAAAGQRLYIQHCGACHQADGQGDGTRFPPIVDNDWVNGDRDRLIRILLEGQSGEIEVNGKSFVGAMPSMHYLSDDEIAKILTYVRSAFSSNTSGIQEVEVHNLRRKLQGITI